MDKVLVWVSTNAGRKFCQYAVGTVSICSFCGLYFPHTFLIEQYRDIFQMYNVREKVPVNETLTNRFNKVLSDLKIDDFERKFITPFMASGFDLHHMGTTHSKLGAYVGLPANFVFADQSVVNPSRILINQKHINWLQPTARSLLKAFTVSEDAQKYGIAREVLRLRTNEVLITSLSTPFTILATYEVCRRINNRFNLHQGPRSGRVIVYLLASSFIAGLWMLIKDLATIDIERNCDKTIAELGPEYVRGGMEFYEKMMKRNMALRQLCGAKGEKAFTANGNEQYFIRQKRLQLYLRKEFFEKKLQELEKRALENLDTEYDAFE